MTWKRTDKTNFGPDGVFRGHSHYVNALAFLQPSSKHPNGLILSGGSDKTIQAFDPKAPGDALYTLVGHTENVCALTAAPNGDIISGSWDFTAKVWRDWECVSTVKHTHSVWAVLGLTDGSYLTGSADKSIKRWMGDKLLTTFSGHTDAVRGLAAFSDSSFVSCSNDGVAFLPNGDILSGASDGFARIFTTSSDRAASAEVVKSYEDSLASQAIPSSQIGDVDKAKLPGAEALSAPGKKDGQVLMVNAGGMVEAHQWSASENQWVKIGEVVDAVGNDRKKEFLGKNYDFVFDVDIGDGVPPLKLPYNASENPYQAAQDFIWKNELPQDYLETVADFIVKNAGGSRYVPGGGGVRSAPPSTSPSAQPSHSPSATKLIPNTTYSFFKSANLPAILTKVAQLNGELAKSMEHSSLALSTSELKLLEMVIKELETPATFPKQLDDPAQDALLKVALDWPDAQRFPGIDILRLVVLYGPLPRVLRSIRNHLALPSATTGKVAETNAMLSLRLLSNLFATPEGLASVWEQRLEILGIIKSAEAPASNKNLRMALATVLLNFSTLIAKKQDDALRVDLVAVAIEFLQDSAASEKPDADSELRAIVGLGTLMFGNADATETSSLLGVAALLSPKRMQTVPAAQEVRAMLK
ncbi:hypothetical protein HKX48_005870 [Thoreauomyces humboldtii]|nr:hypothetical protein HKX48_005870 [Thoreauomyces humboldtii]